MKRLFAPLRTPILAMAVGLALFAAPGFGDVKRERKDASDRIAGEIARLQLHKVYVSDFLDVSGNRTDKGYYFATIFSNLLKDEAKNFEILSRMDTQKFLITAGMSAATLHDPESLAKLSAGTGADAVLFGTLEIEKTRARLTFSLRETASGRELYQTQYRESLDSHFESSFPAATSPDGQFFYFAGLDGTTSPKCVYCPQPEYSNAARKAGLEGIVALSAVFTEQGNLKDIRVVSSLDPTLDQAALDAMQKWKANPAKDSAGNPVPVRLLVEVNFHIFHNRK